MKILHCADVHLDSPLLGLENVADAAAAEFRLATRRAFTNVVRLALDHKVDLVLIAGDLYDATLRGYEAPLFFRREMRRLHDAGIPVALIWGNHDFAAGRRFVLGLPPSVAVFEAGRAESKEVLPDVWVHGQSFGQRGVSTNLALGYPAHTPDALNIGLLHTSLTGVEGHDNYSPCSVEELVNKGYDYWALGHVHQRATILDAPFVAFPGNTQGRHFRETGEKGCLIATVDPTTKRVSAEFHPTAAALWSVLSLDVSRAASLDSVLDSLDSALRDEAQNASGRPLALRVVLDGVCAAHAELRNQERLRAEVCELAAQRSEAIWIERVVARTRLPLDRDALIRRDDPLGEIGRTARELSKQPAEIEAIACGLEALRSKLPPEVKEEPDALRLSAEQLAAWLPEVEEDLLARLAALASDEDGVRS